MKDQRPVIVFIPGFKGSQLDERYSGERAWIAPRSLLQRNSSHHLTVDNAALDMPGINALTPTGVLQGIPLIPGILSYPIYSRPLTTLRRRLGQQYRIATFSYDWRQDNVSSAAQLSDYIDRLTEQGAAGIHLVCHSMGGLIAAYYLRYGAQDLPGATESWEGTRKVDSVVIAGTPFRGAMRSLNDVIYGCPVGRNRSLLRAEVLGSMPSLYQLLPEAGIDKLFTGDANNSPRAIHNPTNWQHGRWGLMRHCAQLSEQTAAARLSFLTQQLNRAREIHEKLHAPLQHAPKRRLPILNIQGARSATIDQALWLMDREDSPVVFKWKKGLPGPAGFNRQFFSADGDDTVSLASSKLPGAFYEALNAQDQQIAANHRQLFNHRQAKRSLIDFLDT